MSDSHARSCAICRMINCHPELADNHIWVGQWGCKFDDSEHSVTACPTIGKDLQGLLNSGTLLQQTCPPPAKMQALMCLASDIVRWHAVILQAVLPVHLIWRDTSKSFARVCQKSDVLLSGNKSMSCRSLIRGLVTALLYNAGDNRQQKITCTVEGCQRQSQKYSHQCLIKSDARSNGRSDHSHF